MFVAKVLYNSKHHTDHLRYHSIGWDWTLFSRFDHFIFQSDVKKILKNKIKKKVAWKAAGILCLQFFSECFASKILFQNKCSSINVHNFEKCHVIDH